MKGNRGEQHFADPPSSLPCSPLRVSPADYWSEDEACQFEESYVNGGKDFANISRALKTRSVAECVSFYYKWKKTLRGTEALMQHKRVLQQPVPFNVLKQARAPAAVCSGGSGVGCPPPPDAIADQAAPRRRRAGVGLRKRQADRTWGDIALLNAGFGRLNSAICRTHPQGGLKDAGAGW